jgi:hypothetical protein
MPGKKKSTPVPKEDRKIRIVRTKFKFPQILSAPTYHCIATKKHQPDDAHGYSNLSGCEGVESIEKANEFIEAHKDDCFVQVSLLVITAHQIDSNVCYSHTNVPLYYKNKV